MQRHLQNTDRHQHLERPSGELERAPRFAFGTLEMEKLECHDDADDPRDAELVEIVHDLKNPLGTMALELGLLADKLEDSPLDIRTALERVAQNVEFLDQLAHEILDACASSLGELVLRRSRADLRGLLERVIHRAVPTRDRSRVVLDAPAGLILSIDELRIERVLANLLQNALDHAPRNTAVVVKLEVFAERARIAVIDAGVGICDHELEHVFERFRRGKDSQSRAGTGLGLYVSRRIVEAHRGTIGVESTPSVGSCFFFELPLV